MAFRNQQLANDKDFNSTGNTFNMVPTGQMSEPRGYGAEYEVARGQGY